MTRSIEDARSCDHACAVPVSDEQLWEMTSAFVAEGLAAAEQVVYFEDGTAAAVLGRLAEDNVEVRGPLADGQLVIVPTDATRAALRAPVPQLEHELTERIDAALGAGYAGFRVSVQASHGLVSVGSGGLAELDIGLDRVLRARRQAHALCLYDHTRFPEYAITELRSLHLVERTAPAIYDDNLLRVTRLGPGRVRVAGEVDHSNRPRIRRLLETALDEALRSHSAPTDITLDLASLRFIDIAGAVTLVHAAEEFPSTHRLVLCGVRPRIMRVLDRCGAPFAAQLHVTGAEQQEGQRPGDGPPAVAVGAAS